MPQFFLNKRLILLLVCIIVLVALIGFSLKERDKLSWPEQFVKDSVGWVQSVFHQPAQSIAGFFSNVNDLKHTYEENKLLKEKLEAYGQLEAKVQELEDENKKLEDVLGKTESLSDFNKIQAIVIGRNPDQWHDIITINKGAKHGVKENMAVITSKGLIGKVKFASPFTSTIQLLSSPDRINRISAYIQGEGKITGLIEGYDQEKKALLFKINTPETEVKKKQKVLTSGLGGVFPRELYIGEVIDVVPDDYGLTKTAYVKPAADFNELDHVIVVERVVSDPPDKKEEDE
ncbi:rod shape-determining protein MreC [Fredinandcohnia quinoae]|uniref:Cell shape-determining protein MreC n=1 Tax=Fredinandcohnia quinoae TaxID=2918902 RepID=A0AAW5E969_9BACI|nr:rod shape-determining protein MreC [Fredinandcohnia sp. SECRCQ15]MCH1626562.1 rod shape-determining protein MreC [Fredinandcohnia sp. SECRCQ15]